MAEPVQNDLFFAAPLPSWLSDETFFSLGARYHRLSGNRLASATCTSLFGHPRQGYQHDLPNSLSEFCRRTGNELGDVAEIALKRTILPFYLPMRTPPETSAAIASLAGTQRGNLKFRLGILTSRFRANHPLKACLRCMAIDRAEHGIAYWHLAHQFPGVWVCSEHNELLSQSNVKSTGVGRFLWTLPELNELSPGAAAKEGLPKENLDITALLRFANLAQQLARMPPGALLDAQLLALTYRSALSDNGFPEISGQRILRQLSLDFVAAIAPLRTIPELSNFATNEADAATSLGRWLRAPRGGTHPLRHLAIIFWLFSDWDAFIACYRCTANRPVVSQSPKFSKEPAGDPRQKHLASLVEQGESFSQISKLLNIDVQTAIAWATKAGYQAPRRPKTLKPEMLRELLSALRSGQNKADLAKRFLISVTTVTRILRSEVGLQAEWHKVRIEIARGQARSEWQNVASRFPHVGIKALRALEPAAYAWLYRNDRTWLLAECEGLRMQLKPSPGDRIDWHLRDFSLSTAVRKVCAEIANREQRKRIALWEIYQVLPELKAKLSALNHLPLTKKAITDATQPRRADDCSGDLFRP